jgi:hypothetical protein
MFTCNLLYYIEKRRTSFEKTEFGAFFMPAILLLTRCYIYIGEDGNAKKTYQ